MQAAEFFRSVNTLLRSWGYTVEEQDGCWSRSNGSGWAGGMPQAHTNHHFVISLGSPIASGVQNVTYGDSTLSGPKCNYYGGVDPSTGRKRIVFISVGPANHAGQGRSEPRDRMAAGQAPLGWVAEKYTSMADNWGGGNSTYAGTELHHPGDSTAWPAALIELDVDLNAAMCLVAGWSANRCHMHAEHSARKIDMSWLRGQGGHELRSRVAARMGGGTPTPIPEELFTVGQYEDIMGRLNTLTKQVQGVYEQTTLLYRDNEIAGAGYGKQSAGFNDVRGGFADSKEAVASIAAVLQDVHDRILPVGQPYDNIQDLQLMARNAAAQIEAILAELKLAPVTPPAMPPVTGNTHKVEPGDTLAAIATRYKVTVDQLVAWNHLANRDAIEVGQILRLGE